MLKTKDTYFALLRKAIWNTQDKIDLTDVDVKALMHLCLLQGTGSLVFDQILKLDCPLIDRDNGQISDNGPVGNTTLIEEHTSRDDSRSTSEAFYTSMKSLCMQNMMEYERLLSLLKQTWKGLVEGGVQPVVLKGFGLATLYPTPYLRQWGDLDIYVGPNQYHEAAEVLRRVFPHAKHHDEEWEELKHYNFVMPDGLVEMHRTSVKLNNPIDNRYFWHLESEAMKPENVQWVEIEDVRFAIPEAKFNLLFTFFHAWFHFVEEGLGFKQINDVALLAHHTYNVSGIDTYLRQALRKLHLWEPWQLMGYVCVEALGLPKTEWPLYEEGNATLQEIRRRFLERVMTEGLARPKDFGDSKDRYEAREKARKLNIFVRKYRTLTNRFSGADEIAPYSPLYARHMKVSILLNGLKRLVSKDKQVDY